jgi:deazaflavin-dependent oxidoreductase (nitroreductase family)
MLWYLEAGPDLTVVASNAGAATDPDWWMNLQAAPEAFVDLPDGIHAVIGRAATAVEQDDLWSRFVMSSSSYETHASATDRPIAVVILEPADLSRPVRSDA